MVHEAVGGGPLRKLTPDLLAQFERRLVERGIEQLDAVAPGLADAEMDALMETTALRLPAEARVWWGWRNGSVAEVAPTYYLITLTTAIDEYRKRREMALQLANDPSTAAELQDASIWWNRRWLPLLETGGRQWPAIDCGVPDGAPSPVREIDWERVPEKDYATPTAPSLGELVSGWIKALDEGVYSYDHAKHRWRHPDVRLR